MKKLHFPVKLINFVVSNIFINWEILIWKLVSFWSKSLNIDKLRNQTEIVDRAGKRLEKLYTSLFGKTTVRGEFESLVQYRLGHMHRQNVGGGKLLVDLRQPVKGVNIHVQA